MKKLIFVVAAFLLCACNPEREGMDFLVKYMPEADRVRLESGDSEFKAMLESNVRYAYRAREEFAWTRDLPKEIFLNEVLPYASLDETREDWRPTLYAIFAPRVKGAPTMRAAIDSVNRHIAEDVAVDYNTAREKANQSPSESMRTHMASCTGLSILLVDALRSVGIPARFAGTPAWHDNRGNHSWVEVWLPAQANTSGENGGQWYFTEYYPDAEGLDRAWFLADAAQADPNDPEHAIYAISYKPAGDRFPFHWDDGSVAAFGAENVTQRYIDVWRALTSARVEAGTHVPVRLIMYRDKSSEGTSEGRVAVNVDVFRGSEQMGGGRTSDALKDMNDVLTFQLEKNRAYTFRYWDDAGTPHELTLNLGDTPETVVAYLN